MQTQVRSQSVKDQHYVPRFYLRKFANTANAVEVLDCKRQAIIAPRGVGGVCKDKYYYGARTGYSDELSQEVESGFQQMESNVASVLDTIIPKLLGNGHFPDDDKWAIALLMSMIWMRGPIMRDQINRMQEQAFKHILAFKFNSPSSDRWFDEIDRESGVGMSKETRRRVREALRKKEYNLEFDNLQHMGMFESIPKFANLFWAQDWVVYISRAAAKFVTSDNPVGMHIPETNSVYGPTFLQRTHYFSLTPDICIQARYPDKRSEKKIRRKNLFRGDEFEVLSLNGMVASRAHHYVYANNRQDLQNILTAIKILRENRRRPK